MRTGKPWWCANSPRIWVVASDDETSHEVQQCISMILSVACQPEFSLVRLVSARGEDGFTLVPSLVSIAADAVARHAGLQDQSVKLPVDLQENIEESRSRGVVAVHNEGHAYTAAREYDVIVAEQAVLLEHPALVLRLRQLHVTLIITLTSEFRSDHLETDFPMVINPDIHVDCSISKPAETIDQDFLEDPKYQHRKGSRVCPACNKSTVQIRGQPFVSTTSSRNLTFHTKCWKSVQGALARRAADAQGVPCVHCGNPLTSDNCTLTDAQEWREKAAELRADALTRVLLYGQSSHLRFCVLPSYAKAKLPEPFHVEFSKISPYVRSDLVAPYVQSWDSRIRLVCADKNRPLWFAALPLPGDGGMGMAIVNVDVPDEAAAVAEGKKMGCSLC